MNKIKKKKKSKKIMCKMMTNRHTKRKSRLQLLLLMTKKLKTKILTTKVRHKALMSKNNKWKILQMTIRMRNPNKKRNSEWLTVLRTPQRDLKKCKKILLLQKVATKIRLLFRIQKSKKSTNIWI
jgi:hypothetical protein